MTSTTMTSTTRIRNKLLSITNEETADKIVAMICGELDPKVASEKCAAWVRMCYNEPWRSEMVMHAADDLLGTFGVEGIQHGVYWDTYCNTGDPYALTLVHSGRTDNYSICAYEHLV